MNLRSRTTQRVLAVFALLTALLLLGVSVPFKHKVYDAEAEEFGLVAFTRISERDLTIDATFGGVTRREGRLYSTYDRSAPRGKQACPT
jgi:hypothetical protein